MAGNGRSVVAAISKDPASSKVSGLGKPKGAIAVDVECLSGCAVQGQAVWNALRFHEGPRCKV